MLHTRKLMIATIAGLGSGHALAGDVSPTEILSNPSHRGSTETTTVFALFDHPGGIADPQAYGLRLDSFAPGDSPVTFSFEDAAGNSTVRLIVTEFSDGTTTLDISGTISGNSADGGVNYGVFTIDLSYRVDAAGIGWVDNNMNDNVAVGGITGLSTSLDSPLGNGDFFQLAGKSDGGDAFRFLADGYRMANSSDEWVGRGWVMGVGSPTSGVNDLLFTAQIVPLPTAAIGGFAVLAGLGVYRRYRNNG